MRTNALAKSPAAALAPAAPTHGFDQEFGVDLARTALALARRFAAGGRLWCVAPEWPEHARHVAVEFVHPVIVGTRALPAVAVVAIDTSATIEMMRPMVAAGDVILAVAPAQSATVSALCQRALAWGATTVWIGAGDRPRTGAADHVLWLDGTPASAYDGSLVLMYHVLWELTHICFEHPGLLRVDPSLDACTDTVCITCSDEGRPGEVVSLSVLGAKVRTAAGVEIVDTTLIGEVVLGDLILVHAGTAVARLDDSHLGISGDPPDHELSFRQQSS